MKLLGRAWLEFEVIGTENSSKIKQTAIFEPIGYFGKIYWYSLYPLHQLIFAGMLQAIADKALTLSKRAGTFFIKSSHRTAMLPYCSLLPNLVNLNCPTRFAV